MNGDTATLYQGRLMKIKSLLLSSFALLNATSPIYAFNAFSGSAVLTVGGYSANQGRTQHINLGGSLLGNEYTITAKRDESYLLGVGYFLTGPSKANFDVSYGVSGFYLGDTSVNGNVIQEGFFTNLSYDYQISHVPVYVDGKLTFKGASDVYAVTVDAGIGPNFMTTKHYNEVPLNALTVPDNAFAGHMATKLSATAGIGVRLNNLLWGHPVELSYRFMYLGTGELRATNSQVLNDLSTGRSYASAVTLSVTV